MAAKKINKHQFFQTLCIVNGGKLALELIKQLDISEMGEIKSIEPEKTILNGEGRGIRPDLYIEMENGVVTIDLQLRNHKGFIFRLLLYSETNGSHLLKNGEDFSQREGKKASTIFIANFDLEHMNKRFYNYSCTDENFKRVLGYEPNTSMVINRKEVIKGDDTLARLLRDIDRTNYDELETEEVREAYRTIFNFEGDDIMAKSTNTIWNEGKTEGRIEGRTEGIAIGEARGEARVKNEMIATMIMRGKLSDSEIAYYSNSSLSDIAAMRRKLIPLEA